MRKAIWSTVTLGMVCWRARVALGLLILGGVLDLLRHGR